MPLGLTHRALDDAQASTRVLSARPADQRHSRDGANARQGFSSKTQCADCVEVGRLRQLAGRETLERDRHLVERDAAPVVGHADQLDAAPANLYADARRTRVDGVLYQLLDHRRRALDHLACGDHGGDLGCQQADWHVPYRTVRLANVVCWLPYTAHGVISRRPRP